VGFSNCFIETSTRRRPGPTLAVGPEKNMSKSRLLPARSLAIYKFNLLVATAYFHRIVMNCELPEVF
jgi:hypothetical protein